MYKNKNYACDKNNNISNEKHFLLNTRVEEWYRQIHKSISRIVLLRSSDKVKISNTKNNIHCWYIINVCCIFLRQRQWSVRWTTHSLMTWTKLFFFYFENRHNDWLASTISIHTLIYNDYVCIVINNNLLRTDIVSIRVNKMSPKPARAY